MAIDEFTVIHALRGRVRLKVAGIKNNPGLAQEIKQRLSNKAGVSRVQINPITGSVLMYYDPRVIDLFSNQA